MGLAGGLLELTKNLRLAQDHRVQATGHTKDMPNRLGVLVLIEVVREVAGFGLRALGEPVECLLLGMVGRIGGQVELGAVAGRDQGLLGRGLGQAGAQVVKVLAQLIPRECQPLAHRQGGGVVVESEGQKLHKCPILRKNLHSVAHTVNRCESDAKSRA